MSKPGLTIEKMKELRVIAEMAILKEARTQVDWFQSRTGVCVESRHINVVENSTHGGPENGEGLVVDVKFDIVF